MYYAAKHILHFTDAEFWGCTPRKLRAIIDVHVEANSPSKKNEPTLGYIDQVL